MACIEGQKLLGAELSNFPIKMLQTCECEIALVPRLSYYLSLLGSIHQPSGCLFDSSRIPCAVDVVRPRIVHQEANPSQSQPWRCTWSCHP